MTTELFAWQGNTDDPSGVAIFRFVDGEQRVKFDTFSEAWRFAQAVDAEVKTGKRFALAQCTAAIRRIADEMDETLFGGS